MTTIHIASGDYTHGIVKRTLGKLNCGVYCECGQFVAFAVTESEMKGRVQYICDGPLIFICPFCASRQEFVARHLDEILLTESNKRRSPRLRE